MGGVMFKSLNYERVDIDLPEIFNDGEVLIFVGKLSSNSKYVGNVVIKYYIKNILYNYDSLTENEKLNFDFLKEAIKAEDSIKYIKSNPGKGYNDFSTHLDILTVAKYQDKADDKTIKSFLRSKLDEVSRLSFNVGPTHTVKIQCTLVFFNKTVYKFQNDNVPIVLKKSVDGSLSPYTVSSALDLIKNNNGERDLKLQYEINNSKGTFTITP
jgi:hypothetical protein